MAGVYQRKSDRDRGKDGKWTAWYIAENGKKKSRVGTTNRKETQQIADALEYQARQVRLGLVDPAERHHRDAARQPIAFHLDDYRHDLKARGDTPQHVANTLSAIRRMLADAKVEFLGDLKPDRIQAAMGRIREKGRSARTCNHALRAVKGFVGWLAASGRIKEYPAGIRAIEPYPEKADKRYVRRPLSIEELERLFTVTASGPEVTTMWTGRHGKPKASMTGPDRAMAYRVAAATGFRAKEVRTLTRERFHLDGPEPTVTVLAAYSKRGKRSGRDDVQPIRRADALAFKAWLSEKTDGVLLFRFNPERTARILAADCRAAGIEPVDAKGRVVDFHSLRYSYVTNLVRRGVNPKLVQKLARHSSITLTMDIYTSMDDSEMRTALEGPDATKAGRDETGE